MLLNYLKIAIRNLLKNKTQSAISIVGLAVGFACITLSTIWIRYEMTYDTGHPNAENIHQVLSISKEDPNDFDRVTAAPLAQKLKQTYPEIEAASTMLRWNRFNIEYNGNRLDGCFEVDSSFFTVFSVQFITGTNQTAFTNPYSILLGETLANELFGSAEQAMGKTFQSESWSGDKHDFTVTGVIKEFEHSNVKFKALVKFIPTEDDGWNNQSYTTHILLKNNINKADFYAKIERANFEEMSQRSYLKAVPISQLQCKYESSNQNHVLPFIYIVILALISILLFICALFNHLSLFISVMFTRLKDLGLRKAIGASVGQLFGLLLTEFVVVLLFAFFLGACCIEVVRPMLEQAILITISRPLMFSAITLFVVIGVVLSIIMASYPIWRICTISVKNNMMGKSPIKKRQTQKLLIIVQLVISILFLFSTIVMYQQLYYIHNKDLGFDYKNVFTIEPNYKYRDQYASKCDLIYNDIEQLTSIQGILKQYIGFVGERGAMSISGVDWEGISSDVKKLDIARFFAGYNFADFFHIPIKEGRFFSKDLPSDADKILVNEKLAAIIGNPIGKIIHTQGSSFEIIGVIGNINDRSLKYDIQPTIIQFNNNKSSYFYIRPVPGKTREALEQTRQVLQKHGILEFDTQSMDDVYDSFNRHETIMMRFVGIVSVVCLFISIFGIYSLTLYSMERRRREVAIRKVMGADVGEIIRMFFKEYLWLVVIACVIALPFAYYLMDKWLLNYANRISIRWWLIAGVVVILTSIVILTVLRQIIKAANSNPADVIKYE